MTIDSSPYLPGQPASRGIDFPTTQISYQSITCPSRATAASPSTWSIQQVDLGVDPKSASV